MGLTSSVRQGGLKRVKTGSVSGILSVCLIRGPGIISLISREPGSISCQLYVPKVHQCIFQVCRKYELLVKL